MSFLLKTGVANTGYGSHGQLTGDHQRARMSERVNPEHFVVHISAAASPEERARILCWANSTDPFESSTIEKWTTIGTIGRYRLVRKDQLRRIGTTSDG